MGSFYDQVRGGQHGIRLYGLAPPKRATDPERVSHIASGQVERLKALGPDAVVVYDIQDEPGREPTPRPFPFLPTIDPEGYAREHLGSLPMPKVVYRSVGQDSEQTLTAWLQQLTEQQDRRATVLVGTPATGTAAKLSLERAYAIAGRCAPNLLLGGIAIAERHTRKLDEHERLLAKMRRGCRFFVTQAVYDETATKSLISDYERALAAAGEAPAPLLLTFSPCASMKTLRFMKWLGVSFPRWLENELEYSADPLTTSLRLCEQTLMQVRDFAESKQIPIGINVESVSIRRSEIEASVELFRTLSRILANG